jgi:hypothetical protein
VEQSRVLPGLLVSSAPASEVELSMYVLGLRVVLDLTASPRPVVAVTLTRVSLISKPTGSSGTMCQPISAALDRSMEQIHTVAGEMPAFDLIFARMGFWT